MNIHIGQKIKEVFEDSGLSVSEIARRIKTTRQNVYGIFERKSIDTELLLQLGQCLKYDFFQHYVSKKPLSVQQQSQNKKVILQIEINEEKQARLLKLALGEKAYKALNDTEL